MKTKISVALATYNGAQYIEEQIISILEQSYTVDEIVVSDDGSSDKTIDIVRKIASKSDCRFVILTDNVNHGPCGNFEHAIKCCSGEYIFLCDQDDIWLPNKVEEIMNTFQKEQDISCVIHNALLVDKEGKEISGQFDKKRLKKGRLRKEEYLETSVSGPIINGMVMCFKKEIVSKAMPFPKVQNGHDQWLAFCALCNGDIYYNSNILALYRLHGNNYAGNSAYTGNMINRVKKIITKIRRDNQQVYDLYEMGQSMKIRLEQFELTETCAYNTAMRVFGLGSLQVEAYNSPKVCGIYKLVKLYFTDLRYKRMGRNYFLYQCVGLLLK